jgi:putative endonuclease
MPPGNPRSLQHIYRASLLRIDPQRSTGTARHTLVPASTRCASAPSPATGEARGNADPRRALGQRGEDLAAAHFQALGFQLLARNQYRRFCGEVDLIVFDGRTLVFVEVKATCVSRESAHAAKYETQTRGWPSIRQFKHQRKAIRAWLAAEGSDLPRVSCCRLDVVRVLFDEHQQLVRLDHIQDAWEGAW